MEAFSNTLRTDPDVPRSPPRNRLSRRHESAANKRPGRTGTSSCRRACVCLLFATILCLWSPIAAQEQGYVQRKVVTTTGAVTFVGNALGLNKDGTNDRPGTSGSLGTFITTDTSQRDNPEWPQGTTGDWRLNSSSAVLSLPSGSRIIHAELIWGGSYLFGSEDVSDFLNDPITFKTPTGTTQVTRDPTTAVTRSGPSRTLTSAPRTSRPSSARRAAAPIRWVAFPRRRPPTKRTSTPPAGRWPFSTKTPACLPAASRCSSASNRREAPPLRSRASARRTTTENFGRASP